MNRAASFFFTIMGRDEERLEAFRQMLRDAIHNQGYWRVWYWIGPAASGKTLTAELLRRLVGRGAPLAIYDHVLFDERIRVRPGVEKIIKIVNELPRDRQTFVVTYFEPLDRNVRYDFDAEFLQQMRSWIEQ